MKVLVTGRGGAASFTIRGEQIGAALGATVQPKASLKLMRAHDAILVVKRVPPEMLADLRASGRPWLYDIVDAYPQPESSTWARWQAVQWVRNVLEMMRPTGVIWPNERMRVDCCGEGPVVYHHHRPGLARNPIREQIRLVGYEGRDKYILPVRRYVEEVCAQRGARFVMNPTSLAEVDVVLALRAGEWDGYVPRHWKSNVKLANAHASGTPFVGLRECGYTETAAGGEQLVDDLAGLGAALDALEKRETRQQVTATFQAKAFHVEQAAEQVRQALCALNS
jgi:hypothetical protein